MPNFFERVTAIPTAYRRSSAAPCPRAPSLGTPTRACGT